MSQQRIDYAKQSPKAWGKLGELNAAIKSEFESPTIIDLVFVRASQINQCSLCLDLHIKEAKIHGERELRLHHIAAWKESNLFTEKEKAALEWTEAITKIHKKGVSDELFAKMKKHFSEKEITDVTFAVCSINFYNRFGVTFTTPHGIYDKMLGLEKAGLE